MAERRVSLTRAAFELIAQTIRELPSFDVEIGGQATDCVRFSCITARFSQALHTTNPRFDAGRFERACNGR